MLILKPRLTYTNDYIDNKYKEIVSDYSSKGRPFFKVVHMSDLHVDLTYTEGSSISCEKTMCCHAYDGFPSNPSR